MRSGGRLRRPYCYHHRKLAEGVPVAHSNGSRWKNAGELLNSQSADDWFSDEERRELEGLAICELCGEAYTIESRRERRYCSRRCNARASNRAYRPGRGPAY